MEALRAAGDREARETGVPDIALREALLLERRTQPVRAALAKSPAVRALAQGLSDAVVIARARTQRLLLTQAALLAGGDAAGAAAAEAEMRASPDADEQLAALERAVTIAAERELAAQRAR
jgi:hypothetical protein